MNPQPPSCGSLAVILAVNDTVAATPNVQVAHVALGKEKVPGSDPGVGSRPRRRSRDQHRAFQPEVTRGQGTRRHRCCPECSADCHPTGHPVALRDHVVDPPTAVGPERRETVNVITAANLRRLIPASIVAAVLAFSWLGPLPSFASNGGTGYNCGVKGIGYHDHGKPCPNRPFPGHGFGLLKFGIDITRPSHGHGKESAQLSTTTTTSSTSVNDEATTDSDNADATSPGKSHGHGN